MGLDLILRCVWTINISLADWKFVHKQYIITGTAVLEAFRYALIAPQTYSFRHQNDVLLELGTQYVRFKITNCD